jgi:2-polyprenyl-3-methyl-5-hydroxy-6-metoxy-1,4-benzoquinol methylase
MFLDLRGSKVMSTQKDTLIVERYEHTATLESAGSNSYKGLRSYALPGLHEFVARQATRFLRPGLPTLDVAAGSGAMSLRLLDLGFEMHATDYVRAGFKLHGTVPFTESNLNLDFADDFTQKFESIIAAEIVEHLENPRHFARQAYSLLNPGGRLLLTTPNLDSMPSKVLFLSSGKFLWFEDQQYRSDGHITPLSQWQLQNIFTEAGFRFVAKTSFGAQFDRLRGSPRLRLLVRMLDSLFGGQAELGGEIFVAVLERPAEET